MQSDVDSSLSRENTDYVAPLSRQLTFEKESTERHPMLITEARGRQPDFDNVWF